MREQRHANRNEMKTKNKNRQKRGNRWTNALNEYKYSLKVEKENHDAIDWNRHQSTRSRSTTGRKDGQKKIQNTFSIDVIITLNYFNLVLLSLSVCREASSRRQTSNETNLRQKKNTQRFWATNRNHARRLDLGPEIRIACNILWVDRPFFFCSFDVVFLHLCLIFRLSRAYLTLDWIIDIKNDFFLLLLSTFNVCLFFHVNPHLVRNSSLFLIQIFFYSASRIVYVLVRQWWWPERVGECVRCWH